MTLPTGIGTYAFLKAERQCAPGLIERILGSLSEMEAQRCEADVDSSGGAGATSFPGAFVAQVEVAGGR